MADFIGESNILDGIMVRDRLVRIDGKDFPCVDTGFGENKPVDVVIRPEDIIVVPPEEGILTGKVTMVTFKGVHFEIIVDVDGFKWMIQSTEQSFVGDIIGLTVDPDNIQIMKKSKYSDLYGDYSSFSNEMDYISDASVDLTEMEEEDDKGGVL